MNEVPFGFTDVVPSAHQSAPVSPHGPQACGVCPFLSRFGRKEQFLIINFSQKQLLADSPDPPWDAIYKCKGAVTRVTQRHFSQGGCHLWALWLLFSIFFENLRPIHSFAHFSQILCCCIAAFSWISSSAVGRNVPSSCRFAKQFEVSFHALV